MRLCGVRLNRRTLFIFCLHVEFNVGRAASRNRHGAGRRCLSVGSRRDREEDYCDKLFHRSSSGIETDEALFPFRISVNDNYEIPYTHMKSGEFAHPQDGGRPERFHRPDRPRNVHQRPLGAVQNPSRRARIAAKSPPSIELGDPRK